MEKFLKAKHWQLFLLTFGIPMIFQFVLMGTIIATFADNSVPDPRIIFNVVKVIPLIMFIFMGIFFCWFWSVATGLQKFIPEDAKMKLGKFKVFLFIPLVYITIFLLMFLSFFSAVIENGIAPNPIIFAAILPFHFFSFFCILYCLYFTAKTFKTAELQRKVTFSDFAGEFFLIWFYPVGIWIIQPKINKMVENQVIY